MTLLDTLNSEYIKLHTSKEEAFWASKMGLKSYREGDFEKAELRLKGWASSPAYGEPIEVDLASENLEADERVGLEGWRHFFKVNVMADSKAQVLAAELIEMEGRLGAARAQLKLGYKCPETGAFIASSNAAMSLMIATSPDEPLRKSAWEGLRAIGPYILDHGFLDVVRKRNQLARALGYEDYYDYKVQITEGFSKATLFGILDDLEANTRAAVERSMEEAAREKGKGVRKPWNFAFFTSGDIKIKTDPFLSFAPAVSRWARSFAAMNIDFAGASLKLDLVNRPGKEENGFMHGPYPAWVDRGSHRPARINFTANAIPGAMGSGWTALHTLFHEGGHAAHFSNIRMPAPCFSQEFAPTSVAFAETQSMFLESLVTDADWLHRYAQDAAGNAMPIQLIQSLQADAFRFRAKFIRSLLGVSYAEKAFYEMSDEELTPENVTKVVAEIEQRMHCQEASPRPILSVPHILSGEASAYYHGYILAEMAVYQTRAHFLRKYGFLTDNPEIGPDLREAYWRQGNRKSFLDFIQDLTGEPFGAKATIEMVSRKPDQVNREAEESIAAQTKRPTVEVRSYLNASIQMVHGDEVIASSEGTTDPTTMASCYEKWILSLSGADTV